MAAAITTLTFQLMFNLCLLKIIKDLQSENERIEDLMISGYNNMCGGKQETCYLLKNSDSNRNPMIYCALLWKWNNRTGVVKELTKCPNWGANLQVFDSFQKNIQRT